MPDDGVQQLGQTQRDISIVVGLRVAFPPFFKARQNLFNTAEVFLDIRKYCLRPQQYVSWSRHRKGKKRETDKYTGIKQIRIFSSL